MSDAPFNRTEFPRDGNRYQVKDYDCRSEDGCREALARSASTGTTAEKAAVRAAVAKHFPDLLSGKVKTARDLFPNSNMKD